MDPKKLAAQEAVKLVEPGTNVGFGAGSTIAYLVELLAETIREVNVYTSSDQTAALLKAKGIAVHDTGEVARIHLYFDGCDQLDHELNALKSGGGIHTSEKLLAAMADVFVLIGDTSKYVERLDTRFPIALEILPEAAGFVRREVQRLYPSSKLDLRSAVTKHGNVLADLRLEALPALASINPALKAIPGIVETSLFHRMAHKAIVAGPDGVKTLTPSRAL